MRRKYLVIVDFLDGEEMTSLEIEELLYASLAAELKDKNVGQLDVSASKLRDFITWADITERD